MILSQPSRPVVSLGTAGRATTRVPRRTLLDAVVMVAVLLFLFLAVGPRVLPYRTVTMLTGSMRPSIPPGSVAVDVAEPVSAIRPGQVLTFHSPLPGHPVVTHRVVSVSHRDGRTLVRTRGDANSAADPWLAVVHGDHVWRVRADLPYLGNAIRMLHRPVAHAVLAWVLPALLLVWFLAGVWRRPTRTVVLPADAPSTEGGDSACGVPAESSRSLLSPVDG